MAVDVLESALDLVALGWPVFPVEPGGKRPHGQMVRAGFRDATTDPERLRSWFRAPGPNLGIAPGPGVLVLDVDQPTDPDRPTASQTLGQIVELYGLELAMLASTASGGWHAYMAVPAGWSDTMTARVGALPGVDLRGLGRAYVVAPPSELSDGRGYRWIAGPVGVAALPSAPQGLIDRLESIVNPPERRDAVALRGGRGSATGWLRSVCDRVGATAPGGRHNALLGASLAAGGLVAAGRLDLEGAREALMAAGLGCGLETRDTGQTVDWGLREGQKRAILEPVGSPARFSDRRGFTGLSRLRGRP